MEADEDRSVEKAARGDDLERAERPAPTTDGTAQSRRFATALQEGHFNVDEMGLADLVAASLGYAKNLNYDPSDPLRGSWDQLYDRDPIRALADISRLAVAEWSSELRSVLELEGEERRARELREATRLTDLAGSEEPEVESYRSQVGRIIEALPATSDPEQIHDATDRLVDAITPLKRVSDDVLERTLRSGRHDPALGLAFAFFRLFGRAQAKLNEFSRRRLEFYLLDVLGFAPRPRKPDQAHVALTLASGAQPWEVPAGMEFSAGRDERKNDIVFVSTDPVRITDARVDALATLHFERDELVSPERELGFVTDVRAHYVAREHFDAEGTDDTPLLRAVRGEGAVITGDEGNLGFAVASPLLLLREGSRTIEFSVEGKIPTPPDDAFPETDAAEALKALQLAGTVAEFLTPFGKLLASAYRARAWPEEWDGVRPQILNKARQLFRHPATLEQEDRIKSVERLVTGEGPGSEVTFYLLLCAETQEAFFTRLGWLITQDLLDPTSRADPSADSLAGHQGAQKYARRLLILDKARALLVDSGGQVDRGRVGLIEELLARPRKALFHDLFRHAFSVRYTGEAGWEDVRRPRAKLHEDVAGLTIVVELGAESPAVVPYDRDVHGGSYETELPVVGFRVSASAVFHPYSLLRALDLHSVTIRTDVRGVTDLVAYNQLGALDPTTPFNPFGPLPSLDSYLVIGSFEAAQKRLESANLRVEWAELPRDVGGWERYYAGYDQEFFEDTFQVSLAVLQGSQWKPTGPRRSRRELLFGREEAGDRIARDLCLALEVPGYFQPLSRNVSEEEFRTASGPWDGMFRLSLDASKHAFGHREYPTILSRALTANANPKRKREAPIPNPPYTPLITRLSLDYVARSEVRIDDVDAEVGRANEKIFHEHPFGVQDLAEAPVDQHFSLMPGGPGRGVWDRQSGPADATGEGGPDGYLLIGLSGAQLMGPLTLLVHFVRDATLRSQERASQVDWFYLASNSWRRLAPRQVTDDSTRGFSMSGIVTLDVPRDVDRNNTILPKDLFWLAIGVRDLKSVASRLHSITAGAVKVAWEDRDNVRPNAQTGLPAGSIDAPLRPVPGLERVTQIGPSFGGRPAEDYDRLVTRASERLRHKNRACTPWDYERIVLERFPYLSKVKCFPHLDVKTHPRPSPGSVLVVVVPRLTEPTGDDMAMGLISGTELSRIERELRALAPPAARVVVRNPSYDQIQVRCMVRLADWADAGRYLQRLNQELVDFIAPWDAQGCGGRFGWSIRRMDVAARIQGLAYVDSVTDLSLLHISEDKDMPRQSDRFRLEDTADVFEDGAYDPRGTAVHENRRGAAESPPWMVQGRYPWSLAVPTPHHFIQVVESSESRRARITGIGEMEIGRTFITSKEAVPR